MTRISITAPAEDDYGDPAVRLVGWFDIDAAEEFKEDRAVFDGANLAGVHMRDQNRGQTLYRTAGGRWVLHQWSRWQGESDSYRFVGPDAAREWLAINGGDDTIERLFGEPLPPESGPGRPEIGPMVRVRLPHEMIDRIDAMTVGENQRAATIRKLLGSALS